MSAAAPIPVSFMDALKLRYGAGADADALAGTAPVQDKKWQFIGAAKAAQRQRQYDRLTLVVLRGSNITCAIHPSETRDHNELKDENMVRLEELDLSENTALTLAEVGKLLPYFPRLTTLQLCDIPNLLQPLLPSSSSSNFSMNDSAGAAAVMRISSSPLLMSAHLSKLVLNHTGFTSLAQLRSLIAVPALKELHLDSNQLTSLPLFTDKEAGNIAAASDAVTSISFPHVTTLSLAHNMLSDWSAIGAAITQVFPALTQLYLTDNKLTDLTLSEAVIQRAAAAAAKGETVAWTADEEAELQPYAYLRALTLLCVKDNATLTSPSTVDAIRVLCPKLTAFRITYRSLLPFWNETSSRMYVVAALPTIEVLNRGTVRPKERLDSELLYLQRGLQQRSREAAAAKSSEAASDVPQKEGEAAPHVPYPLVDQLREKHKDVVLSILKEGDTATTSGANYVMLNVTLCFENCYAASTTTSTSSPLAQQAQKLPSSLTIAKLKALMQKVFQVNPVNQRLSFRSGDHGVLETKTPLENEQETLGYYGVPDGAILYVEDTSLRS